MGLKRGPELDTIIETARRFAAERHQRPSSAHLLLAIMGDQSTAGELLRRMEIDERRIASAMKAVGTEPPWVVERVAERAQLLARRVPGVSAGAEEGRSSGLHLLAALVKLEESAARRCLLEVGYDPAQVGNAALGCLTGGGHKALSTAARGGDAARASAEQERPRRARQAERPRAVGSPGDREAPRRVRRPVERQPSAPPQPRSLEPLRLGAEPPGAPASPAETAPAPSVRQKGGEHRARRTPPGPGRGPLAEPMAVPFGLGTPRRPSRRHKAPDQASASETVASLPLLGRIGRDLSAAARRGELDPLVGRSREIERIVDALNRRRGNVPCVVGDPGVGKTALVEGLALRLEEGTIRGLEGRVLVQVSVSDLLAGTGVRGALAERLAALRAEVAGLAGTVVVFLDEVHTLLAAAGGEAGEGAQEFRAAMAAAEFPCVLATTCEGYRRHVEQDPGLQRRLTRVDLEEPGVEEAIEIVRGLAGRYADHHGVRFEQPALEASVRLSHRYMTERRLPDKAIAVLDLAGARAKRKADRAVATGDVAAVVSELTGVPVERLAATDGERLLMLESRLGERVVGHEAALARIAEALRRNAAGLGGRRPVGSFLLLGPTGVGKTETARALSEDLFPGGGGLSRFDMSELSEPHSVARLVGAPPGYVGHEAGGHLTEAVRARPYQVVLLDEVEKAHPRVLMLLLQVLEEGRLTDGRGRTVDFTSTVLIMTSNLGVGEASRGVIGFGAGRADAAADATLEAARRALPPELWNRFDEVLYFTPLSRPQVEEVARRLLAQTSARLRAERGIETELDDSVVGYLVDNGGYEPAFGARPMRRALQRLVESRIAEAVLGLQLSPGDRLRVRAGRDGLQVELAERAGIAPRTRAPFG